MDRQQIETARGNIDLPAIAGKLLKLQRAGNEWKACCPFHSDKTPSFTIYHRGHWRYHCHGCGADGDGLDWLRRTAGLNMREAAQIGGTLSAASTLDNPTAVDRSAKVKAARRMSANAIPASDTPAQDYLFARGINIPMPDSVRFARLSHPETRRQHPVALFDVTDINGDVQGVQRVYLADDGKGKLKGVEANKLSLGPISGGAIRFAPASVQVTLAEGPETALSFQQIFGLTCWATCGVQMLGKVKLPDFVRRVIIAADNGQAGENGAMSAARAYAAQGREVRIIRPLEGFGDFNDELRGVAQ